MLAVCVYMGGGPSLMYAAHALQAWQQFDAAAGAAAALSPSAAAPAQA
jgi:hypothetical protein